MSANSAFVSQPAIPGGYTVANGTLQTIHRPGGENTIVHDSPNGMPYYGHEFYTAGKKQGSFMQSKFKFSSMPTLVESKGEKKLMKLLKKQEKEEKKRREKEEKKRIKEEKKKLKLEKKLKIKTLPKNFQYTNGHVLSASTDSGYKRPGLSLSAVPIDYQDVNAGTHTAAPTPNTTVPPPLGPSQKTMSMYSSAPDLLRIEQVYGGTLRHGTNQELPSDCSPRTVVLQQAANGYGFVLRGTKCKLKPNGELDFQPSAVFPALQYLDSVDPGSVADRAELKAGDFILEINGENVVCASHDRVVYLIRSAKDQLVMMVVGAKRGNQSEGWFMQDKSSTMPDRRKKVAAPSPPQRDPRTSLSLTQSQDHSINEAMAVLESLDEAIQEKKDGGKQKTASICSRTATKRVSVIDVKSIGLDGSFEKSKSMPDVVYRNSKAKKSMIYATTTVPDWKFSNQKNILDSGLDVTDIASASSVTIRPNGPPPSPPEVGSSLPQKHVSQPPSDTTEVVTITTSKQSLYASCKNVNRDEEKPESVYESSFRPGASAKLSEEPIDSNGYKQTHQCKASAGAVLVRQNVGVGKDSLVNEILNSTSSKQDVISLANEQTLNSTESFLRKYPKAKLLITADALEQVKNRNSSYEPVPDYDDNSEDDKPNSLIEEKQKNHQSVTVIPVGDKIPQTKRCTIHTTIPSQEVHNYSLSPRPDSTATSPPGQTLWQQTRKSSEQNSPRQPRQIIVQADVSIKPQSKSMYLHETPLSPSLLESSSNFNTQQPPKHLTQSAVYWTKIASTTREAPSPPPPLPPPPPPPPPISLVPSISEIQKLKTEVKTDYITAIPQDAIANAVAMRQERLLKGGLTMAEQKPKNIEIPEKNFTQASILAAVAKRREQLAQQSTTSVVETIENHLEKTKKLQAAKLKISSSKVTKKDGGNNANLKLPSVAVNRTSDNVSKEPFKVNETPTMPAKEQSSLKPSKELSFKVKPVNVAKYQVVMEANKPLDHKAVTDVKPVSRGSNIKLKRQESLNLKPEPLEKSVASVQTNMEIKHESNVNKLISDNKTAIISENNNVQNNSVSVQSNFLALAEKKRLEFLNRKMKSSELKSSPLASPEVDRLHSQTIENKQTVNPKVDSPQAKVKSKQNGLIKNVNGTINDSQTSANVPQPPPGFRDGSTNHIVQLEIITFPSNFSSDLGQHHGPGFSPDTASLVSSLSTLSSMSCDQNDNVDEGDEVIAPPPPGFDDSDLTTIAPPTEFENNNNIFINWSRKTCIDKPINDWTCNDVLDWLDSLNMSQYKSNFQNNSIDGRKLLALTKNKYIDLGVAQVGHQMSIERSIKKAAIMQTQNSNEIIASEHL